MPISVNLMRKLESVPKDLREVLLDLVEELERQREESVIKREFDELREIVKEIAQEIQKLTEAQRRTEERINELAEAQRKAEERIGRLEEAVERLAEAQRKTEERVGRLEEAVERLAEAQRRAEERIGRLEEAVERLAEAQRRTEERVNELAEAQRRTEEEIRKLAQSHRRLREEVGGLARSVAYALENDAFRHLPEFLRARGIEVLEKMVRTEIAGEEINLFARIREGGREGVLVGEATLRLDDLSKLRQLKRKAALVETEMGVRVLPVMVTHFAKKALLEKASKAGVLVVQSFEW